MYIESKRTINGYEVRPGARIPHFTNVTSRPITVDVVCDAVSPDRWHAELSIFEQKVITTNGFDDHDKAARAAEKAFTERVVDLLRD